jgi:hypothetical protein
MARLVPRDTKGTPRDSPRRILPRADSLGSDLPPVLRAVTRLQRSAGNGAVVQLLRTSPARRSPDTKSYEIPAIQRSPAWAVLTEADLAAARHLMPTQRDSDPESLPRSAGGETLRSSRDLPAVQRSWIVLGTFASWVPEGGKTKTPCPPGYTEVEGDPGLYGEGWLPYQEGHHDVGSGHGPGEREGPKKPRLIKESKRLAISKLSQGEKGWCYAATSKIIDNYVARSNVPLWAYVQQYISTHGHPDAAKMNETEIRAQFGAQFGVETFLNTSHEPIATILTEEIVHTSLYLLNSPIVLALGNHSYVMYGYESDSGRLLLWDPLANEDVPEYTIDSLNDMYTGQLEVYHGFQPK